MSDRNPSWTGSSTLPRLHQKHKSASTPGSPAGSFSFWRRNTPEPSRAVATSKTGLNGAFGLMASTDFVSLRSRNSVKPVGHRIMTSIEGRGCTGRARFPSKRLASLAESTVAARAIQQDLFEGSGSTFVYPPGAAPASEWLESVEITRRRRETSACPDVKSKAMY